MIDDCHEVPKPEWWNDEALKALSARLLAVATDKSSEACAMRACVLGGDTFSKAPWNAAPRTAAEIKEAATLLRRAAKAHRTPVVKVRNEALASMCDAAADTLQAKEEAEASKARAAAAAEAEKTRAAVEAKAAEALKVAEAKATAAAKELLAEEEKDKQQAAASSTKAGTAKQGKGKKGKGKR